METEEIRNHSELTDFYKLNGLEIEDGRELTQNAYKSLVIYEKDRLIGAATVSKRNGIFVLDYIAVDREYRRSGVGKMLFERVTDKLDTVYLTAKQSEFYLSLGLKFDDEMSFLLDDCALCARLNKTCFPKIMKFERKL